MPELPEVETVKRTLNQLILGKTIDYVEVRLPRIIQRPDDVKQFEMLLKGRTFQSVDRRGKFLRFVLDGMVMLSHLRMEGRYGLFQSTDPIEKHTHVIFRFTDDTELRYRDVRQFGTMHLFNPGEEWEHNPLKKLGLEPLDASFTFEAFQSNIAKRSSQIKRVLLNQEVIAGLGNIYVDEALFRSRIHPELAVMDLSEEKLKQLYDAIIATLQEAVDHGGTSIKSYVNGQGEMGMFQQQLKVYGRKNEPCDSCGSIIERTVVGGRGTHYCPVCQQM